MWITLTVEDFFDRLTAAEVNTLRTTQVEAGQEDPAAEALRRAINEARGYLGARPGATMGPDGTIPAQVEGPVMDLARYRLCSRLAVGRVGSTLLTEAREQEYKDALRLLRDVAAGKYAVEDPETSGDDLGSAGTPHTMDPRPDRHRLP